MIDFKSLKQFRDFCLSMSDTEFYDIFLKVCPHVKNDSEYLKTQLIHFQDAAVNYICYRTDGEELYNEIIKLMQQKDVKFNDNIIYLLTHGEYSDYSIDGVFSSKNEALKYIELENTWINEFNIEPCKINNIKSDDPLQTESYELYGVLYDKNTLECLDYDRLYNVYPNENQNKIATTLPYGREFENGNKKQEYLFKIAKDKLMQLKANESGLI